MSRAGARGRLDSGQVGLCPAAGASSDPVTGRWAGWWRDGGGRSSSSVSRWPQARPLQPAVWASTPLPAKDDGSIALGFMVSLEGRQAGHFTWRPSLHHSADGESRSQEAAGQQESPPPPRPTLCVGLLWIRVFLTLSFLLSSTLMVMVGSSNPCSTDSFL